LKQCEDLSARSSVSADCIETFHSSEFTKFDGILNISLKGDYAVKCRCRKCMNQIIKLSSGMYCAALLLSSEDEKRRCSTVCVLISLAGDEGCIAGFFT
jgi:hypothetical protein